MQLKTWWGREEKPPKNLFEKTKEKPRLISLPFPIYDVESRLFSGIRMERKQAELSQ